jgi:flagellar export protein FliJ
VKRFRFTLQALLIVLEQREQTALTTYARALADRRKAFERWLDAQRLCEEGFRLGRQRAAAGVHAEDLAQLQEYCRSVKELEQIRLKEVQRADRAVDSSLARLLAARQAREAVQRVRQAQRDRYDLASRRVEQKVLDELAQHMGVEVETVSAEFGG